MSEHRVKLNWSLGEGSFDYRSYSRDHEWHFKNGVVIIASAAPQFRGSELRVDPEEAFVGSLSSCHMLTFLAICANRGIEVLSYADDAVGFLKEGPLGKLVISEVELRPVVVFGVGASVSRDELEALHNDSHHDCFLANSVKTEIKIIID